MAADILLYQADKVPVGEDQRQHLELTRDLAVRFNARYGETFVVPGAAHHPSRSARSRTSPTRPSKMSKSVLLARPGSIDLLDEPRVNVKKIKSAVTDSGREITFDEVGQAGRLQPADHPVRADRHPDRAAGQAISRAAATATSRARSPTR